MTDLYAVIGNPITHSKSQQIHNAFAQATGQDLSYDKLEGRLGAFTADVDAFRHSGGRGLNVTIPFKLDAFAYATQVSQRARQAGAANALKFEGDTVWADNFDGIGLVNDIQRNLDYTLEGRRVLLLGAGGAARGAVGPLLAQRPACVVVANRTEDKAQAIVADIAASAPLTACGYAALAGQQFDVIINATSTGLSQAELPISASVFAPGALAYDMVYGKGLTRFLQLAQGTGHTRIADGVGMLVEQAAETFVWWRGVRPDTRAVIQSITVPLA